MIKSHLIMTFFNYLLIWKVCYYMGKKTNKDGDSVETD